MIVYLDVLHLEENVAVNATERIKLYSPHSASVRMYLQLLSILGRKEHVNYIDLTNGMEDDEMMQ